MSLIQLFKLLGKLPAHALLVRHKLLLTLLDGELSIGTTGVDEVLCN